MVPSGAASLILGDGCVRSDLRSGLTSDLAGAAGVVWRNDLSAGSQFFLAPAGVRSDRPSCPRSRGSHVRRPAGAWLLQPEKGTAVTIVETRAETRAITGGVDTHADVHVAAALDPSGLLASGNAGPPGRLARLLRWLGGSEQSLVGIEGTGTTAPAVPACHHGGHPGGQGGPLRPPGPPPSGRVRPAGGGRRCPGRPSGRARRAQGPGRRRRGDRALVIARRGCHTRTHPDDQPGQGPGPDRA